MIHVRPVRRHLETISKPFEDRLDKLVGDATSLPRNPAAAPPSPSSSETAPVLPVAPEAAGAEDVCVYQEGDEGLWVCGFRLAGKPQVEYLPPEVQSAAQAVAAASLLTGWPWEKVRVEQ